MCAVRNLLDSCAIILVTMENKNTKKVLLVIMDGWGLSPITEGNATILAKTPVLDYIYATYPKISIAASGLEVGLNRGEMGNSEVGHLNLGTGRVVWESMPRIDTSIEDGTFVNNPILLQNLSFAREKKLHLIGLVSSGGIHSHFRHLVALIEAAKKQKVSEVCIHFISDGRDTSPNAAAGFASDLEKEIKRIGLGKIVSLVGRYYAMDRDKHWERTALAYNLFVHGEGRQAANIHQAIEASYGNGKTDEFIEPFIIDKSGIISEDDAVVFYNFRADRMRQIVESFITENFKSFTLKSQPSLHICTMTEYEKSYALPVLFAPVDMKNTLADILEKFNKKQTHIAETEKYAHVTYFFNGGREQPHDGETQILVKSPRVATYDLKPEMSAHEVANKTIEAMRQQSDFIVVNFANGDMVGHTGILKAAIAACEEVDKCLFKVLGKASELGYNTIVTADHGNCEIMIDPATRQPSTEHTTNPVPFVYLNFPEKPFEASANFSYSQDEMIMYSAEPYRGVLSDVASTILGLLKIDKPAEIEGINLVERM